MKKYSFIIFTFFISTVLPVFTKAQCAMCTKTAAQLGEKPALGLNNGILYLMLAPFAVVAFIGYRWWQNNK